VQLTLVDTATGTRRDMRTASSYQWNTGGTAVPRKFRVEATAAAANTGLRITGLIGRSVGRGAGVSIT
jgi:hypothetical protein